MEGSNGSPDGENMPSHNAAGPRTQESLTNSAVGIPASNGHPEDATDQGLPATNGGAQPHASTDGNPAHPATQDESDNNRSTYPQVSTGGDAAQSGRQDAPQVNGGTEPQFGLKRTITSIFHNPGESWSLYKGSEANYTSIEDRQNF
jgi:hypothetical protein